jgi:hypothetical protein
MASEKKKRKVDKRLHWGRGGAWLKWVGKYDMKDSFNQAAAGGYLSGYKQGLKDLL